MFSYFEKGVTETVFQHLFQFCFHTAARCIDCLFYEKYLHSYIEESGASSIKNRSWYWQECRAKMELQLEDLHIKHSLWVINVFVIICKYQEHRQDWAGVESRVHDTSKLSKLEFWEHGLQPIWTWVSSKQQNTTMFRMKMKWNPADWSGPSMLPNGLASQYINGIENTVASLQRDNLLVKCIWPFTIWAFHHMATDATSLLF